MQNIFFPVETIARELDYRLLLAAKVLKKGRRIYICNHRHLDKIMHHFRGGIYVGKHIFHSLMPVEDWDQYKKAKRLGIDIIYLNEEGAIYSGTSDNWEETIALYYDPKRFDANDRICVWGEWQKSIDEEKGSGAPIHVTGHPRFDLYKKKYRGIYEKEVNVLKKKYADFILVNGNYGSSNNGIGVSHIFSPKLYDPSDPKKRQRFIDFYAHSTKSMVDMISLVHRISTEFPEKCIIYRNHPSEGNELYKHVFRGLSNVKIIHEGPVGPWILAAETIIHDGCTTAIEASFSDTKIINYKTNEDAAYDIRLPNLVGTKAITPENVIEIIKKKESQSTTNNALKELSTMIENYHNDSFSSLSDVIEEKINTTPLQPFKSPLNTTLRREFLNYSIKRTWKKYTASSKRRKSSKYAAKKFPGFDLNTLQTQVRKAEKIMDTKIKLVYSDPLMIVLESSE